MKSPKVRLLSFAVWTCSLMPWMLGAQKEQSDVCGVVVDLFGNSISAATVDSPQASSRSITNASGEFCIRNLPAGDTLLSVTSPGFSRQQKRVKVQAESNALVDFALAVGHLGDTPSRTVSGIIEGENGRPLVGVRIAALSCFDSSRGSEALSDAEGKFTISLPEPGQYCICSWAPGYTAKTDVFVVPGGTKPWATKMRIALRRFPLGSQ